MRHITLFVLLFAVVSALPTPAAKTSPAASPTLTVSCGSTCSAAEPIIYSGTGYKAGSQVELDITGPVSYVLSVTVSSGGTFDAYFGGLTYPTGNYTVTASAVSGRKKTVVATAFLDVI
jgi:hypothetical protein